jgi:hypothetical protein
MAPGASGLVEGFLFILCATYGCGCGCGYGYLKSIITELFTSDHGGGMFPYYIVFRGSDKSDILSECPRQ